MEQTVKTTSLWDSLCQGKSFCLLMTEK